MASFVVVAQYIAAVHYCVQATFIVLLNVQAY
jgi:hypothetical protein